LFTKGHPKWGGRPKGGQNHRTLEVKEVISEAARRLGGVSGLVKWAKKNDNNLDTFWSSIYPKLLPLQVGVRAAVDHRLELSPSDLEQALRAHGLTSIADHGVFGAGRLGGLYDAPPLIEGPTIDHEPSDSDFPANGARDGNGKVRDT
jgi:hypothetical protein